jgi:Iron-containing redox enzyme
MRNSSTGWTRWADELVGPRFSEFQIALTAHNSTRFEPRLPEEVAPHDLEVEHTVARAEIEFIEAQRKIIAPLVANIPSKTDEFIAWFERLKQTGPGQGDPLFPWLATEADSEQMKWFLLQEVAGEAGFDDLLAMTQVKMSTQAKLEMARNFWDEMGRGREKAMHGPMLERLAGYFELAPTPETVVPESLALGNTMVALARHRRYAFHSAGALGVIEMTAPTRAGFVDKGLRRLKIPPKKRHYFALHAVLDIKHSEEWNREVLRPLVAEDPRRARAIGEGAIMRLWHGARCFERYRQEFGLSISAPQVVPVPNRANTPRATGELQISGA